MPSAFTHGQRALATSYNAVAVDAAIASSNRAGRRIRGKEAAAIHALLKGRTPPPRPYVITMKGRTYGFETLELASECARDIFARTGVAVGIEKRA